MDEVIFSQKVDVRSGGKPAWQQPKLIFVGKLGDLVQGHGKTDAQDDADPFNTAKHGVG